MLVYAVAIDAAAASNWLDSREAASLWDSDMDGARCGFLHDSVGGWSDVPRLGRELPRCWMTKWSIAGLRAGRLCKNVSINGTETPGRSTGKETTRSISCRTPPWTAGVGGVYGRTYRRCRDNLKCLRNESSCRDGRIGAVGSPASSLMYAVHCRDCESKV